MKTIIFATLFVCTLSLQSIAQNIDSTIYCSLEFDKGVAVKDVVVEYIDFGKSSIATINANDSSIAALNKSIMLNSNTAMGFRYNCKYYYISIHDRCLQEAKSLFNEMMKSNVKSIKIMITIAIYENVYYREDPYAVIIDIKRKS